MSIAKRFKGSETDPNSERRRLLESDELDHDGNIAETQAFQPSYYPASAKEKEEFMKSVNQKRLVIEGSSASLPNQTPSDDGGETEKVSVSFFNLYRFSSSSEKVLVLIGLVFATSTGIVPALANLMFGKFTKTMVAYASNTSRKCPPSQSNTTSPFMKEVETFVLYQSSLAVCQFLFGYIFVMTLNYVAEKQVYKIRKQYFRKLLQQEVGWHDKNSKRDFSSRMMDDMLKIQRAMSEKIGMLVRGICSCVFLTCVAFYVGWKLTLALMSLTPLLAMINALDANLQSSMTTKEQDAYAEAGAIAEEVLTNIRTVHAFGGQERELKRYDGKIIHAKKLANRRHLLVGLGHGLHWAVSVTSFAYAFWYGSVLVVRSRETGDGLYGPDNVLVVLFSVLMVGFYFGTSSDHIEAISGGKGSAASIFPILDRISEIDSMSSDGIIPTKRPTGDIVFRNVSFSYPTRSSVNVLNELSIHVKPGQTVALVGASGCGKSTCVQLLQRFYDPSDGEIMLDGTEITQLNIKWYRSQLGVVGQEPTLFNTTIAENIAFGRKGLVSRQEIEEAAKQAYAHNFIMLLPQGYDTRVGERGTSLSGGQKQRVAIARALVRNPAVLLLDEATSALDFESEKIVQLALERASQGRSTLIIAHRLSTIRGADKIYVMDKGSVIEEGTHDELMQLKGRYHQLVLSQDDVDVFHENDEGNDDNQSDSERHEVQNDEPTEYNVDGSDKLTSRAKLVRKCLVKESHPVTEMDEVEEDEKELLGGFSIMRLSKMNLREWPFLVVVFICSLVKGFQLPVYAYVYGAFIQSFTLKDDFEVLAGGRYYCSVYLSIACIAGICGFLQMTLVGFSGERLTYRIRKMLFSALLEQDIGFYDEAKNSVGNLTARLSTDASSIRGVTGSRLAGMLQAFATVVGAGAMSFYFFPRMAAVTILFVPMMIYVSFMEGRVMRSANVLERDSIEQSCNLAVEALSNIRTVTSLCAEEQCMELYEEALVTSHKISTKRAHVRGLVYGFVNGAPMLCYCLNLWYGGYLVEQSCVGIRNVFMVAEALIYCSTSAGAAVSFAPDYDKGKIAAARIFKLLDFRPLISRFSTNTVLGAVKGQVNFDKVNFHYKCRPSVKVLKNLSLEVKAGENVAIVGSSGSGKSTCAALIFRFYDPVSGAVKFDEFDLTRINLDFIRQQISLVSQEPILFDCSIKENIAYGDNTQNVEMDEIIEAAKATNMHSFITSLPAGYETRVGMLGNQMSGGQKQRIAIARAIVRQPKLLVLDEATSALDSESEIAVQTALDSAKSGRTSVTIAHRLSSIANSDKIFVMKNGRIEECGTHTELIHKNGGIYQTMWNAQSSSQNENDG